MSDGKYVVWPLSDECISTLDIVKPAFAMISSVRKSLGAPMGLTSFLPRKSEGLRIAFESLEVLADDHERHQVRPAFVRFVQRRDDFGAEALIELIEECGHHDHRRNIDVAAGEEQHELSE